MANEMTTVLTISPNKFFHVGISTLLVQYLQQNYGYET